MRILLGLCWWLIASVSAHAQALEINAAGTYTLSTDLSAASGAVVAINADHVILNLNGKTIRCTPSVPATAVTFGVNAGSRTSVTIKGGTITGCFFGVNAAYGSGVVLEDLTLGGTYIGANLGYGVNTLVRRVTCRTISGYTVEAYAICINGIGNNGVVEDSTLEEVYRQAGATGTGEGVGLLIEQGAVGVQLRRSFIRNAKTQPNTIGVWSANAAETTITGTVICGFATATQGANITLGAGNTISTTCDDPTPPGKWFRICVSATECYEGLLIPVPGGGV